MPKKLLIIGLGIIVLLLLWSGVSIYPDWLWFKTLGFAPVFWTMLLSKFGFGFVVWILLMVLICVNLYAAKRLNRGYWVESADRTRDAYASQLGISERALNSLLIAFILILSFFVASKSSHQWGLILRYLYQQPFNSIDPVFQREIGFYVFSLPFYVYVRSGLLILLVLAGLITLGWYLKDGTLQVVGDLSQAEGGAPTLPKITIAPNAKRHLVFLGGFIALLLAWGYYLKTYNLLYSTQGPAFGASYTDVHIKIFSYRILILFSLALAFMLFLNTFRFKAKQIWSSIGIWIAAVLVFSTLLPVIVQKFIVKPNELTRESPYIAYNIELTRRAYNLDKIKEVEFKVHDRLTSDDLDKHGGTIRNIRIWDERPLLQTFRQIQTIRLYYDFMNVDVDRYIVNDQYRQVMLGARELVAKQLPAQAATWVNRHLSYTHGYGLALCPVNEVTGEGLPRLLVKDLPPSFVPGLEIYRPEIYYGEKTEDYVLIKTKMKEFDYPKGDKNAYTFYEGKGGIPIDSFFRRLLFAFEFLDPQILFTTYLNSESRIMYNRRVARRAALIAPFLKYDGDPYLVISEGRLFWILDAYTISNMYPYSRRSQGRLGDKGLNYIRNAVKITIDAYNGDTSFYMVDDKDPIVNTYSKIFPRLFKPFEEMPGDLKKHIRYPKDLFKIQAGTYTKYHMEDVQVFYNQEDLWQVPDEMYGDRRQEMEPYYIIMKLPQEIKEEFLLMLPFTPSKKDNMIGWLAARSDLQDYGTLVAYKLPKEKLVYGPMQIEARVDQQTEISRELSLWGQRGSRVIRGNLLAIPVGETFIYVEPVYLEAKQEEEEAPAAGAPQSRGFGRSQARTRPAASQRITGAAALPELKRVIVAFGDRLIMEENLEKALSRVLDDRIRALPQATPLVVPKARETSPLSNMALEHYQKAQGYLRQGKWAEFGRELEALEKVLTEMVQEMETKKE
jgi:uncharacterized membrane protein (UPF0182 family)